MKTTDEYRYIGKDGKPILARELEDQRDDLKAKLAKAVEALSVYADGCDATERMPCGYEGNMCCRTAKDALAEITGGKDE